MLFSVTNPNTKKTSPHVLQKVFSADLSYISNDSKMWMCKTCDRAVMRGSMPLQANANGLQLSDVPPELSDLNALELRLISLRVQWLHCHLVNSGQYMDQQ